MNELVNLKDVSALANVEVTKELVESANFSEDYLALKAAIKMLSDLKSDLDSKISSVIVPMYENDGTTTVSSEKLNFTYCAPTTSLTVDSAKLKKDFPDVYKQCVKTQNRNASLRVTEKKIEENA